MSPNDIVAEVTTYGGHTSKFKRSELEHMLANKKTYVDADNLFKWLRQSKKSKGFPKSDKERWDLIEHLSKAPAGKPSKLNVRSDEPWSHSISHHEDHPVSSKEAPDDSKGGKSKRTYEEYLKEKKEEGGEPMPKDEWEARFKSASISPQERTALIRLASCLPPKAAPRRVLLDLLRR